MAVEGFVSELGQDEWLRVLVRVLNPRCVENGRGDRTGDETGNVVDGSEPTGSDNPRRFYAQLILDQVQTVRDLGDTLRQVVDHLDDIPGGDEAMSQVAKASSGGFD